MMKIFFFRMICLLVLVLVAPPQAMAQGEIDPLQRKAEAALFAGDAARAAALTQRILAQDPDSFDALFILSLAQSDLGAPQEAATTAAQAYRIARTQENRMQAAQIAAEARFQAGQYARSELWLRRAANHATTAEDRDMIARDYVRATQANPFSVAFTGAVVPSNNINDGSDDGILAFEGIDLVFLLPEDQRALSGLEFSGSADIDYRLSYSDRQTTTLNTYLFGQTYRLSSEAQDLLSASPIADVQNLRGRDFSSAVVQVGLRHSRFDLTPVGPTTVSLDIGRLWRGGDHVLNYHNVNAEQIVQAGANTQFSFGATFGIQDSLTPAIVDARTYDLTGGVTMILQNADQLYLGLSAYKNAAGRESSYIAYRSTIGYALARPVWSTYWSVQLELGYRHYDEYTTTLYERDDHFATLQADVLFDAIKYYGFSPQMTVSAARTRSNAEEKNATTAEIRFAVVSNF